MDICYWIATWLLLSFDEYLFLCKIFLISLWFGEIVFIIAGNVEVLPYLSLSSSSIKLMLLPFAAGILIRDWERSAI